MPEHPFGWWSLVPPVAAIVLAIATRRAIVSLLLGVAIGAFILAGGNPLVAVPELLETHLWSVLMDDSRMRVFAFTLLMGAMVGVVSRGGGMKGLVEAISPLAKTRRRGQLTTWLLGLVVFFDDYANTLLLGSTLRPLSDRLRLSRAKLAYLVDSTSAPVAGLALVSTWVAGELSYVQDGLDKVPAIDVTAFALFVETIPYRFYVLWALLFVPLVALSRRDFGPMLDAERRAAAGGDNTGNFGADIKDETAPDDSVPHRWFNAVVPVVVTVGVIVWLLHATGVANLQAEETPPPATWQNIFGAADANKSLLWGSLAGLICAAVMAGAQRILTASQIIAAAGAGAKLMLPALAILWLASSLSTMTGGEMPDVYAAASPSSPIESTDNEQGNEAFPEKSIRLYTGVYLGQVVKDYVQPVDGPPRDVAWLLPTLVFVLAAVVAFATGTSWGTMGIVMPIVIELVYSVLALGGQPASANDPIFVCSVGSVLAGAIFGDHCSPISDTTVLSSQASGCDHIAHVWTQLPYALLVGAVTIAVGTVPVGLGVSVWICLPLGVAALVVALLVLGRRIE